MILTRSAFLKMCLGAGLAACARPSMAQSKEWKTIRFVTEGAFPPFNGQSPDGTLIGFEPELVAEIGRRLGVTCEITAQAWDGMIESLTSGKYDAVVDAVTITDERLKVVDFSSPYTTSTSGFVVMKGNPLDQLPGTAQRILADDEAGTETAVEAMKPLLKGKTIGVQTATIQETFVRKHFANDVDVRVYSTYPDALLDLSGERIDGVFSPWTNSAAFIKKTGEAAVAVGYNFGAGVQAVAIRKNEPELKAILDRAIGDMKSDGTLKKLSLKWFEVDMSV